MSSLCEAAKDLTEGACGDCGVIDSPATVSIVGPFALALVTTGDALFVLRGVPSFVSAGVIPWVV